MQLEIISILCSVPAMLFALSFHEFSHALAAYRLGDDTAKRAGRLTLNPLKHLDIAGAIALVLIRVGWAKPVPVNANNFANKKRGMALTALAGPLSNLLLGVVGVFLAAVLMPHLDIVTAGGYIYYTKTWKLAVYLVLESFYYLNLSLAVFNMLPIPPFDGSRIALLFLPTRWYFKIMRYERAIMSAVFIYFIACMLINRLFGINLNVFSWILRYAVEGLVSVLFKAFRLLPFIA